MNPATKADVDAAIAIAIADLKVYIERNENSWLRWIVGIQISYFALVLGVVYFAVHK